MINQTKNKDEQTLLLGQKNKLLRYKLVKELYEKHKTDDIALTVVLRKYINPVYPMSRTTLYNILCTPINRQLKEIAEIENRANTAEKP